MKITPQPPIIIDYAKIKEYVIRKENYIKDKVEMLKVFVDIKYSCSYKGTPQGGGTKTYTLYDGVEIADPESMIDVYQGMMDARSKVKKDVAGWPE